MEISRCSDDVTFTKIILTTGGETVNDDRVDRLATVTYLNLLQKSIKMDYIGLDEEQTSFTRTSMVSSACCMLMPSSPSAFVALKASRVNVGSTMD